MMDNFDKIYNEIIAQNNANLIEEGFFSNLKQAAKEKIAKALQGDKGLYFNSGNDYADFYEYVLALKQLFKNKIPGLPEGPFSELTSFAAKAGKKKGMLQAMRDTTASARLADDVVKIDEAITKPITEFKNEVTDTIKTVYQNAKNNVIETIMLIVEAIKCGKDKIIEWFNQGLDAVKGIADDVKEKIKAKIEELKNLAIDIASFSFDVIKTIIKIIGIIAVLNIAILVFVGKKIVDSYKELVSFINAQYENAEKTVKKAAANVVKNIAKVLKSIGNSITALGEQIEKAA